MASNSFLNIKHWTVITHFRILIISMTHFGFRIFFVVLAELKRSVHFLLRMFLLVTVAKTKKVSISLRTDLFYLSS